MPKDTAGFGNLVPPPPRPRKEMRAGTRRAIDLLLALLLGLVVGVIFAATGTSGIKAAVIGIVVCVVAILVLVFWEFVVHPRRHRSSPAVITPLQLMDQYRKTLGTPWPPAPTRRLPYHPTMRAKGSHGLVLPDGRVRQDQGPEWDPGLQYGDLPVSLACHRGLSGRREGIRNDEWVWLIEKLQVVNDEDAPLTFNAHLAVPLDTGVPLQLLAEKEMPFSIGPHGAKTVDLSFRQPLWHSAADGQLDPNALVIGNLELVLLELGRQNRELRVPFTR
jgi:hypothetical protein